MVDPTTANTSLAVPLRGSNVGTWDVPVNDNTTAIDGMFGGVTTVALTSASVTLASSQGKSGVIRITGTITQNLVITLPGIYKSWVVDNQITNSPSSFAVGFASSANFIGIPPGVTSIVHTAGLAKHVNLGKIGEFWDYAGSAVPTWAGGVINTVPPYLLCDGTAFSSATYPVLANLIGTTLPDARGRSRFNLNQGTARLSSGGAGIDGNTNFASGGANGIALSTAHIPSLTSTGANTITVSATNAGSIPVTASASAPIGTNAGAGGGGFNSPYLALGGAWTGLTSFSGSNNITVTYSNTSQSNFNNAAPGYVGGITMIRAG